MVANKTAPPPELLLPATRASLMSGDTKQFPALPLNPTAFREIDTHQKAYLLGFLLADGCVLIAHPGRYRARVNLRILAQDIRACRMVQEIAGGNLRLIEDGYRVLWEVNSDAIATDLIALGVTPKKSFTASIRWDLIPADLHGSVLAGLIDGDGHLRIDRAARRIGIQVVTGSVVLKDQLLERFPFFKATVNLPSETRKSTLYCVEVESNRKHLRSLIDTVYAPLPFKILDRKQRVLDQIITYLDELDAYDAGMEGVPRMKAEGLTIDEIATKLGTSRRPILERLKKLGIKSVPIIFTEEDRQEIKRLHNLGLSVQKIHAAVGKGTEQAVRFHLQRMGCLTKSAKPFVRNPNTDEILTLHREGLPAYEIAERVNLGKDLVREILNREGVPLKAGSPLKLTEDIVAKVELELSTGRTLESVAAEVGVSTTLIRVRLKERAKARRAENPPSD